MLVKQVRIADDPPSPLTKTCFGNPFPHQDHPWVKVFLGRVTGFLATAAAERDEEEAGEGSDTTGMCPPINCLELGIDCCWKIGRADGTTGGSSETIDVLLLWFETVTAA